MAEPTQNNVSWHSMKIVPIGLLFQADSTHFCGIFFQGNDGLRLCFLSLDMACMSVNKHKQAHSDSFFFVFRFSLKVRATELICLKSSL